MILICGHEDVQPLILLSCHLLYFNVSSCKGLGKLTSLVLISFNVHLLNLLNFKRICVSLWVKSVRPWPCFMLNNQSLKLDLPDFPESNLLVTVSHNISGCCFSQQPVILKLALFAVWFTIQCYCLLKLDIQTFAVFISTWITYLLLCNLLP